MKNDAIAILKDMKRIRYLEERSAELYGARKIRGFLHLYVGQEAVAAGVLPLLGAEDAVVTAYREHGHALLRGISARAIIAEMFGKEAGCSRGRGGSMHLFDAKTRFFGGSAIVAGGLPIAVGLALADRYAKKRAVTACFFGDGAVAEGEFHESMNLAALWRLPVLFLCENNFYAMGTSLSRHQSQPNIAAKAEGYAIPAAQVDGMDPFAVREAAEKAITHVREHGSPYFLELLTYRFRAHSMFDPELYRSKAEVSEWRKRDPIPHLTERLLEGNALDAEDLAAMDAAVQEEVNDAVDFAEIAPLEPVEELERFVYAERGVR
jgi:pyruvate dehydrogenase E1 component alpha subunit